jgi:hypothetical protein
MKDLIGFTAHAAPQQAKMLQYIASNSLSKTPIRCLKQEAWQKYTASQTFPCQWHTHSVDQNPEADFNFCSGSVSK